DGQWHEGDFAGGRWSVRMIDETGRISLNKADEVLLRRVITNLAQTDPTASMDRHTQEAIDTVVDSILDWRDHDNLKRTHGAESAYYLKRRVPYRAKNAFFDSPDEPHLVTIDARGDLNSKRNLSHVAVVADLVGPASEGTRIIRWLDRAPWDGRPPGPPAAGKGKS